MLKVGVDVGSTTVKMVATDEKGKIVYSNYKRHNAKAKDVIVFMLKELEDSFKGSGSQGSSTGTPLTINLRLTGSVGMGLAERHGFPFVQEVVAATKAIQNQYPGVQSMIDIGGEDAKIVFFKDSEPADLRMNGNCAGGTGSFIDQMAIILGVSIEQLNELAMNASQIYPIASRCGVFCKTDIQNLVAKNVRLEDIAASIFHAVAVQTVLTLARGYDITPPIIFCGGPLTFIPALRKAFADYLSFSDSQIIVPDHGTQLPALGSTLAKVDKEYVCTIGSLIAELEKEEDHAARHSDLAPAFASPEEYKSWKAEKQKNIVESAELKPGRQEVYIGIDSGSTTTKIVVTDSSAKLIYSFYSNNGGKPIDTVERGLKILQDECRKKGTELVVKGSCSTGYGEDLIKAAFQLDHGIVETIAHYIGAHHFDPEVSFILDIGGQDMKAIFVNNGIIDRIEINEACSSGCGSFIETFAKSLGFSVQDFAQAACRSTCPADLGTRCTVFMNSKVKQVLREGATIEDIAAGLAYSVVKNCLYKVLKLKDTAVLGNHIVVQGGTMRNDAVVRALETLTGAKVTRCNIPELMGAYGCALYALEHASDTASETAAETAFKTAAETVSETAASEAAAGVAFDAMISKAGFTSRTLNCKGCDNQCLVTSYRFESGKHYYSGNRCEKIFTNGEKNRVRGENMYQIKNELLFNRHAAADAENQRHTAANSQNPSPSGSSKPALRIGIPRVLNMFEDYPFWRTLFEGCGIETVLSDESDYSRYEKSARKVMSDNICFPAKLVHSHIQNLIDKKVDRIFMPFVVFEREDKGQNSYNCPVVTGYSEVVKSVQGSEALIDSPAISLRDKDLLLQQCEEYLGQFGIGKKTVRTAFKTACDEQNNYVSALVKKNEEILEKARKEGRMTILLAGRPYHADMLIQHKVSDMLADMGISIVTDDIVRDKDVNYSDIHFLAQWSYPNRILSAAKWGCEQDSHLQFVQLTSFGCGPDAFLVDEIRDFHIRNGKVFTLLKLDDVNNVGSMKLRARSLIESIRLAEERKQKAREKQAFRTVPAFDENYRDRKILVPFFTPFISPLIPAIAQVLGYDAENLPVSDTESCDWGLKYANNEICYPATLVVGDIIKAFKSGKYDPEKSVVAITQTGGQCRASNYLSLIKKALIDAGYKNTPVISLTMGSSLGNDQPAFKIDWPKVLPTAVRAILYSDCIAKFYFPALVREKQKGDADRLKDKYLGLADKLIREERSKELLDLLSRAAEEFNEITREKDCPKVGIVGEIYLKFNTFAHRNIETWLSDRGIEVVPSVLTDFFMQTFVNTKVNIKTKVRPKEVPNFLYTGAYKLINKQIAKFNKIASKFRNFIGFEDIFEEAEEGRKAITLNAQFGEGWLLPAEILSLVKRGVNNVVSLQPFGCIANHIVARGVEKRIKTLVPDVNLLALDFDSGVSDVNITNRMLLFVDKLEK